MDRLSPQTKWMLIFGLPAIILFVLIALNANRADTPQPTEPVFVTLPTQPTFEKGDPNFISPYDKDDLCIAALRPVWNYQLVADDMTISTTTEPEAQYADRIDVEDVVTIHLPRQRFATDMSQAKALVILHEDMQDPYITPIQAYKVFCESQFTPNEDGSWTAKFMLGYDAAHSQLVDVLLIYNNNVEYYTMLYVTQKHQYSKMYYQWLTPDKAVAELSFVHGNTISTYGYYPEQTNTLIEWINSETNPHQWHDVQGMIVDPSANWYLPSEQANQPLTDGATFQMTPVSDNMLPGTSTTLHTSNPEYITALLCQPQNIVTERLGEPKTTLPFSRGTKMEYDNHVVYLDTQNLVIQIDVLPGTQNVINTLPTQACSGDDLTKALRLSIIPYSEYHNRIDVQAQYYSYSLPIFTETCTISYVWEGELQINPKYDEFTRIVIHAGEKYIY